MKINRAFVYKGFTYCLNRIRFLNVKNKNILNTLNREVYYKKYKRKYKKYLVKRNFEISPKNDFSNKVWIFWYQGLESAPELVQSTINSIKEQLVNKEIVVLTKDNLNQYVELPTYIEEKFKKGYIPMAHYSDLVRLELLTTFGGLWIDSTVLLTGRPFFVDQDIPLFVYKNISLFRKESLPVVASNWLIYSNGKSDILFLTKDLMFKYWEKTNYVKVYSIFHVMFKLATDVYKEEWENVPSFSNVPPHILQFELLDKYVKSRFDQIKKMSDVHKLNHRLISNDDDSYYGYVVRGEY